MKIPYPGTLHGVLRTLLLISTFTICARASAHEVWIEDTPDGRLVVRFADYGEKFETSPGALDGLTLPFAWAPEIDSKPEVKKAGEESRGAREERDVRAGKVDAFEVHKETDGFVLTGASASRPAQIETGFTVMGRAGDPEKPARKPYFYARWQPVGTGPVQPGLNFDLVPTGVTGQVCVYFRGKPLAGVKVKFYPPGAAEQELVSDTEGLVHFTSTKPGLYLLTAAHQRETISGFFGGKAYDAISHNCSLCWRQP